MLIDTINNRIDWSVAPGGLIVHTSQAAQDLVLAEAGTGDSELTKNFVLPPKWTLDYSGTPYGIASFCTNSTVDILRIYHNAVSPWTTIQDVLDIWGQEHAARTSANAGPYNLAAIAAGAAVTLTVDINCQAATQTFTFASTNSLIANFAAVTAAEAAAVINAHGNVELVATSSPSGVTLTSVMYGTTYSLMHVTGGTANHATYGFNFSTTSVCGGNGYVNVYGPLQSYQRRRANIETTAATYDVAELDDVVMVNRASTVQVNLPAVASAGPGRRLTVKDTSGHASGYNITIATPGSEKIDGADTAVISTDYGKVTLIFDGTNWFSI